MMGSALLGSWLLVGMSIPASHATGPMPTLPARSQIRAPFTVGTIDLRHVGRAGEESAARERLLEVLRDRGLPVLGGEPRGPDRTVEARFALIGEITAPEDGAVAITWQLVDRRDEATLFEAITRTPIEEGTDPLVIGLLRLVRSPEFDRAIASAASRSAGALTVVRRCETPGTHGRGQVGRGASAGAAVVVSPDGYAWAAAGSIPVPPAPIEVRTATGTWPARWLGASAELDVALLALPTGSETPCAAMADHIPRAREMAVAWHPRQGRQKTRILGFRLHEQPGTIVVEAALAPGAFLFDRTGAVLGLRQPDADESQVRPHVALTRALGQRWGPISVVPEPPGGLRAPDPLFLPPIARDPEPRARP